MAVMVRAEFPRRLLHEISETEGKSVDGWAGMKDVLAEGQVSDVTGTRATWAPRNTRSVESGLRSRRIKITLERIPYTSRNVTVICTVYLKKVEFPASCILLFVTKQRAGEMKQRDSNLT